MASRALVVCDVGQILIQSQMLSMALVASLRRQHFFPRRVILMASDGMAFAAGHVIQRNEFWMLAAPSVASNGNLRSVAFLAALFIPGLMNAGQGPRANVRTAARRQQPSRTHQTNEQTDPAQASFSNDPRVFPRMVARIDLLGSLLSGNGHVGSFHSSGTTSIVSP
jgi:hypothetical protein